MEDVKNLKPEEIMVWVDIETTGLSCVHDLILEIGVMVTDLDGNRIAAKKSIIADVAMIRILESANEIVQDMHNKNGLKAEIIRQIQNDPGGFWEKRAPGKVSLGLIKWMTELGIEPKTQPMAGSTIFFDRKFIEVHMPELNRFFNHRHIDISTIKELCKRHNPALYAKLPRDEEKAHRPLEDLKASIKEYLFYRDNFLWTAES